jgi:hypothetical protein
VFLSSLNSSLVRFNASFELTSKGVNHDALENEFNTDDIDDEEDTNIEDVSDEVTYLVVFCIARSENDISNRTRGSRI